MGASAGRIASDEPCCAAPLASIGRSSASRADPVCVTVCGAAGQIGYSLLPMIASGCMFGDHQKVRLQCLDLNLPEVKENMRGIQMELQDGHFPLLHKAVFTTDDAVAFRGADYAILLGAFPRQEGRDKSEAMEKNVLIFRTMGNAIQEHANKGCKVLVVGNPANTNAFICAHYAPALPKEHFFALTRLDQNRAVGQIAQHTGVSVEDVKNVVIWGCHARFPDVEHSIVKGRPLTEVLSKDEDKNWLNELFRKEMQQRGTNIIKARKASAAMSTARAIVDHIHDLHFGTRPGEFVSMGVWSDNTAYDIAGDLVFSFPVVCVGRGQYRVQANLPISKASKEKLKAVEEELIQERELARKLFQKHTTS